VRGVVERERIMINRRAGDNNKGEKRRGGLKERNTMVRQLSTTFLVGQY